MNGHFLGNAHFSFWVLPHILRKAGGSLTRPQRDDLPLLDQTASPPGLKKTGIDRLSSVFTIRLGKKRDAVETAFICTLNEEDAGRKR